MHNNASKLINSDTSKNCLIILTKDHHLEGKKAKKERKTLCKA